MFPFSFISGGGVANTERTQAFLTATGITDATIISALNAMDTSLISAGLLPAGTGAGKIKALYPIVGGTAATHKFNFVDPRDLDAAFRLVFFGGITHNANGITPNGTNGYADTFFDPIGQSMGVNNKCLLYYSRTAGSSNALFGNTQDILAPNFSNGLDNYSSISGSTPLSVSLGNTLGLQGISKIIANDSIVIRRNATSNKVDSTIGQSSLTYFLFARNVTTATQYTALPCSFASISEGLTDVQLIGVDTIVENFQTTLGRKV
jgi:hypothetical protein